MAQDIFQDPTIIAALELTERGRDGHSHSFLDASWKLHTTLPSYNSWAKTQSLGHICLQGRLGNIVFILDVSVPSKKSGYLFLRNGSQVLAEPTSYKQQFVLPTLTYFCFGIFRQSSFHVHYALSCLLHNTFNSESILLSL